MVRLAVIITVVILVWLFGSVCGGAEPHWASDVIARGAARQRIEATPVEARPNRPLHFYGNTVRRIHYRGDVLPRPRDLRSGWRALVRRPYVPL